MKGRIACGSWLAACRCTHGFAAQSCAAAVLQILDLSGHTCGRSLALPAFWLRIINGEFCTLMLPYVVLYPTDGWTRGRSAPCSSSQGWSGFGSGS